MLDVGGNVLVMGIGDSQRRIVGMGLGIVPIQSFVAPPDYIAILQDIQTSRVKVHQFSYVEANVVGKNQNSDQSPRGRASTYDAQGRGKDRGKCFAQAIDKYLILGDGAQSHAGTPTNNDSRIKVGTLRCAKASLTNRRYFSWRRNLS